jgi:tetratricopeptide (TPR) repeat protein
MPALTAEEIWSALAENGQAPNGPVKIARAEYLVDAAETVGEPPLYAQALLHVVKAYEYGAEQPKLLVPFARLLRLWDENPGAFDQQREHSLFWYFKWASSGMLSIPEVPLASVERWLGEMESRYRQAGHSPRAVHMGRYQLAREIGDAEAAEREFEAWMDAPRDAMADCEACEAGGQGRWHASNGRDEQALELWGSVLGGELSCAEEPHRVLSHSLLPLLRLGRLDEARANHLRGYRMARGVANLRSTIARHVEFCALTGNEARGLEILTEHAAFLAPRAEDAESRLDFLTGALILLRRLDALGLGGLAFGGPEPGGTGTGADTGTSTVAQAASSAEAQIAAICARFDARNGNTTTSDRTAQRLAREPLVASLPLGSSTALPQPELAPRAPELAQAPAATSAVSPSPSVLDDLVAQAEHLTKLRHPHAHPAWERVAASGFELPEPITALVERSRARELMERDPAAARSAFQSLAERFAALGEPVEAREARGSAAFAAFLAGDEDAAEAEAVVLGAEAETAYAAGELTPRQYLGVRNLSAYLAFNAFARLAESSDQTASDAEAAAPDPELAIRLVTIELDLADQLGDPGRAAVFRRMLAQLAFFRQEPEEAHAHLVASRDRFLAAGQTWDAAEPEATLGQLALQSGDAAAAERHVRDALDHGGDLAGAQSRARLGSLLVEALTRQPDRNLDLVDAALRAADLWEGLSEPDTLHNRFTAARAYLGLERYGEAAALFDELMPRVHVPYEGTGIAMTREQYGECLTKLAEHRKAAEQYLAAAALVQDDPQNQVAHARVAWSAAQALQSAGLPAEALPAYRRAADLWGGLGNVPARVRCLRSAAWLLSAPEPEAQTDTAAAPWPRAIAAMRAVLDELAALPEDERSEAVEAEVESTVDQLEQMLKSQHYADAEDGPESEPS